MKVSLLEILGDPFIGIYISSNDNYTIIPKGLSNEKKKIIKNTLKTELIEINYKMIGTFSVMGKDFILLSNIVPKEVCEEIVNRTELDVFIIDSEWNVISNTMFYWNNKLILSTKYSEDLKKELEKELGLDIIFFDSKLDVFAQYFTIINNKIVFSPILSENECEKLKNIFNIQEIETITINNGSVFIRSGLVNNSKGILLGKSTTPVEYNRILNLF